MQKKLLATPALAGLVALPIAGYATFYLMNESPFYFGADRQATDGPVVREQDATTARALKKADAKSEIRESDGELLARPASPPKSRSAGKGGRLTSTNCRNRNPAKLSRDAVAGLARLRRPSRWSKDAGAP